MATNSTRTEYQKERRRVLQAVRRAEKSELKVDRSLVPELKKHPTKQDIDVLKSIKPTTIRTNKISEKKTEQPKVSKPQQRKSTIVKINKVKIPASKKVTSAKPNKIYTDRYTAEQLADIRKRAGKKAWETRRSKMSDEQYEEYKKQFVQRMRQARDIKKKIESDLSGGEFDFVVPLDVVMDTSLLDYIRGKINEYVDKFYVVVQEVYDTYSYLPNWAIINEEYKNSFINAFDTLVNNLGEQKAVQYLRENEYELVEALQHKWFGSSQAVGEVHYMTAMNILTQGNISTTTAEIINAVNESYDSELWDYTMGME